jgi:hypothetical protein
VAIVGNITKLGEMGVFCLENIKAKFGFSGLVLQLKPTDIRGVPEAT